MLSENSMKISTITYTPNIFHSTSNNRQSPLINSNNKNGLSSFDGNFSTPKDSFKSSFCGKTQQSSKKTVNQIREERLKRRIKKLYNVTYDRMKQLAKQEFNLDLVKPTLVFNKEKINSGSYEPMDNSVIINLYGKKWNNNVTSCDQGEMLHSSNGIYYTVMTKNSNADLKEGTRYATRQEREANIILTIAHELAHAAQFQIALSSPDAYKTILKIYRETFPFLRAMSDGDALNKIKEDNEFLRKFKPQKDTVQTFQMEYDNNQILEYSGNDFLYCFLADTDPTQDNYTLDITEMDARITESKFAEKYLRKLIPDIGEGVTQNFIDSSLLTAENFAQNISAAGKTYIYAG